ncbi:MAG: HAMP domain-containing histidine kinase [Acetatifactor sp.]|nr:HAMP domain-containing histidine kinase [Acetatifactor sp.]
MRRSIRRQLALTFIGLMALTVALSLLINNLFLEKFYIADKTKVIRNAFEVIAQAANQDNYTSEAFVEELNRVCTVSNVTVCVMDSNAQMRYESANGGRELEQDLYRYLFGQKEIPGQTMEETSEYVIEMVNQGRGESLIMFGRLSDGVSIIMRTPIESIRESVAVANRFFLYTGVLCALIGAVIFWLTAGKISRPIKKLSDISEQMVRLQFEAKYDGKEKNEIGMLGSNINKLSESLEKAIAELKTANNELMKDIEKKEQIDEMRREFLANVSHELKTPIALIQGYAEGLSEGVSDDPESRAFYCEVIMDEARKMHNMVQKLMSLNQIESGSEVVNLERFDLTEMMGTFLTSARMLADQNDMEVIMNDYEPCYVWGDRMIVEEVLTNYFSNAVHHCSGEKKIVLKIEKHDSVARVSVFNTGEAIPEESLPHPGEKFYKVDKARTREYGGSGIGLSIVKALMESLHQGYGVENYQNGVRFWFELEQCEY